MRGVQEMYIYIYTYYKLSICIVHGILKYRVWYGVVLVHCIIQGYKERHKYFIPRD